MYQLWVLALTAKLVGSTWDMAWHFRWLRDDLAPPHLINSFGTGMVVALVVFHSYTGYGVDRIALRLMQVGVGLFLLAVPLDLINHRINGLDITAWSPSHALLYLGTGVMAAGALRGWWLYGPAGAVAGPGAWERSGSSSWRPCCSPRSSRSTACWRWRPGTAARPTPSRSCCSSPPTPSAGRWTGTRWSRSRCPPRPGCTRYG